MKQWAKCVGMLSIMIGVVLFPGVRGDFSAWGSEGICDPSDPENLLTIFHGGENGVQVPDEEEIDPGALTMPYLPMRLVICKPEVPDAAPEEMVTLDVIAGKEQIILLDQAQENEIPTSQPFPLAELPALVWVKPTQSSEQEQDIRICAKFQKECQDFVTATALLNLEAHWPGTLDDPGEIVTEAEEDNSLNLIGSVNDDDDNDDDIIDNDREQSPSIVAEDDDVMTFIVRKLGPEQSSSDEPVFQEGTLELFAGDGLHVFTADGTQELTLPLSVDFANPSGPLANVLYEDVTLLVEANIPVERTMVELIYFQNGKELARDEVHLRVVHPTVKGSFTRGSVRYSEAMQLRSTWIVFGMLTQDRPLSLLISDTDQVYESIQYKKATEPESAYKTGWRLGNAYFQQLTDEWNALLASLGSPHRYTLDDIIDWFVASTGIPEHIATSEGLVTNPGLPITDIGRYDIRLCYTDHNRDKWKDIQINVIKPGNIWGMFRTDLRDPTVSEWTLGQVFKEGETFFRPLGGVRMHLQTMLSPQLATYQDAVVGYAWSTTPTHPPVYQITAETFETLRNALRKSKIPQPIIGKLQELLENNTFPTEEALLLAMQPAFNGYTITQQVLDKVEQRFLNERVFFPDYFFKLDDGLSVLRQKDGNTRVDTAYWSDDELQTFWEAAQSRREGEGEDSEKYVKYHLAGYRLSDQALTSLLEHDVQKQQTIPFEFYRKLERYVREKTLCDKIGMDACIRGTEGEGYSFRNVTKDDVNLEFLTALRKALDLEPDEEIPYLPTIMTRASHWNQFSRYVKEEARQENDRYFDICKPLIVKYATPDTGDVGKFFPSYRTVITDPQTREVIGPVVPLTEDELSEQKEWADDPLLLREEIYWQSDSRADLDEMVTFSLTFGKRIAGNQIEILGTVPITRRMRSRVLQQTDPMMGGDDVMMLQTLLTFLGWDLTIDGAFGPGTAGRVKDFKQQNIYGATSIQVDTNALELLHTHFDDYRWALNTFGWNDGENPDENNITIKQNYRNEDRNMRFKKEKENESDGWVEQAASLIKHLKPGIITPNPDWSTDERDLLLAVIWKESSGTHWDNWNVTMSVDGALGFLQVMPFNSKRYNSLGILPASLNLYKPDDNLKQAAHLLEEYSTRVFGDHADQSDGWQVSGDDDDDVLAKVLACYNGGKANILRTHTWENICKDELIKVNDDDPFQSYYFAVKIKNKLGLNIEDFEKRFE